MPTIVLKIILQRTTAETVFLSVQYCTKLNLVKMGHFSNAQNCALVIRLLPDGNSRVSITILKETPT